MDNKPDSRSKKENTLRHPWVQLLEMEQQPTTTFVKPDKKRGRPERRFPRTERSTIRLTPGEQEALELLIGAVQATRQPRSRARGCDRVHELPPDRRAEGPFRNHRKDTDPSTRGQFLYHPRRIPGRPARRIRTQTSCKSENRQGRQNALIYDPSTNWIVLNLNANSP